MHSPHTDSELSDSLRWASERGSTPMFVRTVAEAAPTLDRYAQFADVRLEVDQARKIYSLLDHENALQLETPLGFNGFPPALQTRALDWLETDHPPFS